MSHHAESKNDEELKKIFQLPKLLKQQRSVAINFHCHLQKFSILINNAKNWLQILINSQNVYQQKRHLWYKVATFIGTEDNFPYLVSLISYCYGLLTLRKQQTAALQTIGLI